MASKDCDKVEVTETSQQKEAIEEPMQEPGNTSPKNDDESPPDQSEQKDETDTLIADLKDALSFGRTKRVIDRPDAEMPVGRSSPSYNMEHKKRGYAIIIGYSEFSRGGPSPRDCAPHDIQICELAFKCLGYDVRIYENLKKTEFLNTLERVQNTDHTDNDSLVVVFMSHGGLNEKTNEEFIWTSDAMVNTKELWMKFTPEKCPTLAGKPKLFFIQACRGEDVDKGVQLKKKKALSVQTDAITVSPNTQNYAIPLYADMLMMWASYPGMFAFKSRNNGIRGSVFLHFLAKVLKEDAYQDDLFTMLLRVTREVATHYESYVPGDQQLDKNKQIPQIVSTMMRKLTFF